MKSLSHSLLLIVAAFSLCGLFASCSQLAQITGGKAKKGKKQQSGLEAYRKAGGRIGGFGASAQTRVTGGAAGTMAGIAKEEDILWAPEDPDEPISKELEELWKKPENKSWITDYSEAVRFARSSGRPMLIWFTNTARSPLCRALSRELFSTGEFEAWAKEHVVRLRVDSHIAASGEVKGEEAVKKSRMEALKKRYKVMGHPTVVMVSPSGAILDRYRGYKKGGQGYYWAKMKQVVRVAERNYGKWREQQEAKGYRLWTSREGRKTFAKLYRFRNKQVTLVDPDGKIGRVSYSRLSDADQDWIMMEKRKYDARKANR